MMTPNLPNECLLEIFKYIEEDDDRKSLYSILLVNRTWCQLSVPILWRKPFKEHRTNNLTEPFKVILPLISYLDKKTKYLLKIDQMTRYYIPEKPMFNYASFIKELDYINMYHLAITCLKKIRSSHASLNSMNHCYYETIQKIEPNYYGIRHEIESMLSANSTLEREDSNKLIELIYKIIINNSRIESLILDMYYLRSKDVFNALLKTSGQGNTFYLKNIRCKLLVKDINILLNFLKLDNNRIKNLSLSLYDKGDEIPYLDLINLIKSQRYLETLHVNDDSCFTKLILSELQNDFHSVSSLNLISHNNNQKSDHYFLNDEWSNSLELTFNDLKQKENLKDISFPNLKSLKLDWNTNTFSSNQLKSQENEIHQSIISLIQNHNIDLKQIDLNPLSEFHFKNIFKILSKYCSNLQKFSYNIHNLNDLNIVYSIFQNNLELLSIDINFFISFESNFFQNIPIHIQNITLRNYLFDQNILHIFLNNIKCKKLKSFMFIWKNAKEDLYNILKNLEVIFRKISHEKGWIIKDYKFKPSNNYLNGGIIIFEWE